MGYSFEGKYIDNGDFIDLKLSYEENKVPEKEVMELAKQIAFGMQKIHQKNIVHKDLGFFAHPPEKVK